LEDLLRIRSSKNSPNEQQAVDSDDFFLIFIKNYILKNCKNF